VKIGIVVSRFNHDITSRLRDSCVKTLEKAGIERSDVRVVTVPGGYELPWTVNELALSKRYGVVIALGCILKGSTPQNDHISRSTVQHLHDIAIATRVPVILGVITPNTHAQAVARSRGALDRGKEAAHAALEMLKIREELAHGS
jgi:6,7-dimethyl-8-ribityllumazine synthase